MALVCIDNFLLLLLPFRLIFFSFPGTIEPIQLDDCVGLLMYYYKRAQQFIDVIINMMMRRSGDAGERNTTTTRMCTS